MLNFAGLVWKANSRHFFCKNLVRNQCLHWICESPLMTYDRRRPLMGDDLWCKATFEGTRPSMEDEWDSETLRLRDIETPNFFRTPKFVFHQRLSSIKSRLSSQVLFLQRFLPSKVVFHHRSSSIKDCLSSKFVDNQRLSSIKSYLPSMVVFHQRLSSIKSRLPSKGVFH